MASRESSDFELALSCASADNAAWLPSLPPFSDHSLRGPYGGPKETVPSLRSILIRALGSRTGVGAGLLVEQLLTLARPLLCEVAVTGDLERELLEVERLLGVGLHGDSLGAPKKSRPVGSTLMTGAAPA